MYRRLVANVQGKYRRETLEGRPHLVVPIAILPNNDVVPGSGGPVLYPEEENKANPAAWNHMPIVLYHPEQNGEFVTARQPTFINTRKIGVLLNSGCDDKVRTEGWFDEERTKEVDVRIHDAILNEQPMEVSTGLNFELEKKEGEINGKKYVGIARNYQPDHLAILPDKIGAYPVARGGGLYANMAKEPESLQQAFERSLLRHMTLSGLISNTVATINELSYTEISRQLSDILAAQYGEKGKYWRGYLCEVYSDYCVFEDGKGDLWKVGYAAADTGVSLKGDAVKVVRTVDYATVANEVVNPIPQPQESNVMDKKAYVASLIANGQIEESQRAAFEALDENTLKAIKLIPKQTVTANVAPAVAPPVTPPVVPAVAPVAPQTAADYNAWMSLAPKEFQQVINQGQKALKLTKSRYIEAIKANPNNKFSDAQLEGIDDLDHLAAMAELARGTVQANQQNGNGFLNGWQPAHDGTNYSGAAGYGAPITNTPAEAPPEIPDMVFDSPFSK